MDTNIFKASLEDINDLELIESSSLKCPWNKDNYLYEIQENPVANILIYKIDNQVVGFIDFWITFDSCTIARLAVLKDFRRQHIASKLFDAMIEVCKNKEVIFVTLEVRKTNTTAISFYENKGFKNIGIKPNYYNDFEDAIYFVRGI